VYDKSQVETPLGVSPLKVRQSLWDVKKLESLCYQVSLVAWFSLRDYDKLYSPQMVVTANTTKYTIENNLTKKEKKTNQHTNKWHVLI